MPARTRVWVFSCPLVVKTDIKQDILCSIILYLFCKVEFAKCKKTRVFLTICCVNGNFCVTLRPNYLLFIGTYAKSAKYE